MRMLLSRNIVTYIFRLIFKRFLFERHFSKVSENFFLGMLRVSIFFTCTRVHGTIRLRSIPMHLPLEMKPRLSDFSTIVTCYAVTRRRVSSIERFQHRVSCFQQRHVVISTRLSDGVNVPRMFPIIFTLHSRLSHVSIESIVA